jgi:hypothetical protein
MTEKRDFLERVKTFRLRANGNLHKTQVRYKRNYDRGAQPKNANLREGDQAYLRVEVTETGRNHKLESLVQGHYEVVENAGTTFRLRIGDETVRVSSELVTPEPVRESSICPEDRPKVTPTTPKPVSLPLGTNGPIPGEYTPNHGLSSIP